MKSQFKGILDKDKEKEKEKSLNPDRSFSICPSLSSFASYFSSTPWLHRVAPGKGEVGDYSRFHLKIRPHPKFF
jgi:hypothetical protein